MSETWHPLLPESEFPEEGKATARLGGWHVLVVRTESGFHALNDRCTHQAALISTGRVRRGAVMCPLHGARFDVRDGRALTPPAVKPIAVYEVKVEQGRILVRM